MTFPKSFLHISEAYIWVLLNILIAIISKMVHCRELKYTYFLYFKLFQQKVVLEWLFFMEICFMGKKY